MNVNSISKDKILLHTNCNDIFIKFLGLNEFPKGNISSPFAKDENPSFKVWSNGTFKCNSSGKQGDVWQFVAELKNLDCKKQFNEVLQTIAIEMNIPLQENETHTAVKPKTNKTIDKVNDNDLQDTCNTNVKIIASDNKDYKIDVKICEMQEKHIAFWHNLGVEKKILDKYKVNAISNYSFFSIEKNKRFNFNIKNEIIAFCYEVNGNFEVYVPAQPNQNQKKVFNNGLQHSDIFGLEQLGTEKIENLIICAGKKDTIIANSRGFKAVTFKSETHNPTIEQIEKLQSYCNNLLICYDNDKGGETGRNAITKKYNSIIPILLPKNENIKGFDITDYFKENTAEDFQKLIDLALKNKTVVGISEYKKYSQYELPKEVKEPIEKFINDIENFSMFMANCKIWILKGTEKKKYFREVSNFEIEIIQHMQDELQPLKLVRIKNTNGLQHIFDTQSDRLNSVTKFDDMVTNFGNFLFTGAKSDFDILRAYLFAKMGNGKKIECLGWQKEYGFWLWNNKVNTCTGKFIEIDENGIFIYKNTSFYVPSANKIYKNNSNKYEVQKGFICKEPSIKIDDYLKLFNEVYRNNSITAILFTIASLFQDIVVKEINGFPILFLKGIPSSGKDNLAYCCQSFFGIPQKAINVGSGVSTQKSQIRELAQFKNSISQFSEYKYGDKQLDEILKGIWDRNGYKIATIQSKTSTDTIPVDSSLILTGNYNPVDDALITRLLWLEFNIDVFTEKETEKYNNLKDITKNGISKYSDELLLKRNLFEIEFKEKFRSVKNGLDKLFPNAPSRISTNFAVLNATYDIFKGFITFPFTENEMISEFTKLGNFQLNKINSASIVNKWWDIFLECLKIQGDNKIQLDKDVKVLDNKINFNFSNVYGKIQRQWYNQYKEAIPSKNSMQDIMLKDVSYLEKKDSFRFGALITSVYIFDLKKVSIHNEISDFVNFENQITN